MDAIIKVDGITKKYKEFTLDHVSFQVPRGMILGLIGENGAVLMSTHITSDLDKIADHIVLLHQGRVMFQKTKEELDLNYGVLHCGRELFESLAPEDVAAYIRDEYQYRVLVKNRGELESHIRDLTMDRASIEDIMLFYIKGERL